MRIAFYTPYLDTAGGGEKYILTAAEYLLANHDVDVLLDNHLASLDLDSIKKRITDLHNLDLSKINFVKAPLGSSSSPVKRALFLRKYDYLIYLTDGSIFYSTAKKNILHIQSPINNINNSPKGKVKLSSWKKIIYNSKFTKTEAEKSWKIPGIVIYPPVSVDQIRPKNKKKQILSVGRFFGFLKDKKHELLIDAFKKWVDENNLNDWSLHLVGGTTKGDESYLKELRNQAKGTKIFLHPNLPFTDLKKLYGESQIYWHATGFGEDDPTKMEHFGISTVEAMAGGAVPVVVNAGGQKEIVEQGKNGFLWDSIDELLTYTMDLVEDSKLWNKLSKDAVKRSKIFKKQRFEENIKKIIDGTI